MVFHLLELFRTILRIAPDVSNQMLKKQCLGLSSIGYLLVTGLYEYNDNNPKTRELITSVISTTEEVTYRLIRRLPGLFYVISDSISANYNLLKIYIEMTGDFPNLLSTYTHITTLYLFISKDKANKLAEKIISEYLEAFVHSIFKVLSNLCTSGGKERNTSSNFAPF